MASMPASNATSNDVSGAAATVAAAGASGSDAAGGRYACWRAGRESAARRRRLVESAVRVLSIHVLVGVLVLQARHLLPGDSALGAAVPILLLASLVTFDVMLLSAPTAALDGLERLLRWSVLGRLRLLSGLLLVVVYVLLSPLSGSVGRRGYLRRRPEQAAWFSEADWQVSTWKGKPSEAVVLGDGRRPRLFVLLSRVRTGGGLYLTLLTLLVLLALTLNVAAGSAKLAPFIYTLF
jgi:hypothetical protein